MDSRIRSARIHDSKWMDGFSTGSIHHASSVRTIPCAGMPAPPDSRPQVADLLKDVPHRRRALVPLDDAPRRRRTDNRPMLGISRINL